MENINRNLQQKGNPTNTSGDSGNCANGNSGEGAREDRWRRLEIPLFSGDDAYGWVNRVERHFNLKGVLKQERLQAVMVAMEGRALSWFRWWRFCVSNPSWEDFKAAVIKKEMETELELHAGTVVEVQEADVADKIQGQDSDAELGDRKTKKECFKEVIAIRFGNSEVLDKRPPLEPPDWVACVVFETTPAEQVDILLQDRNVVLFQNNRKWDAVKENNFLGLMGQTQLIQLMHLRTKIVDGNVLQAIHILCNTFKQKLEAGLGEAFKGS
ncbi:hypothetical protein SESBI_44900 [Sesbania bispinosa]|nr:hypothetical protein SESBI_44900 [Sesbania bispinosa]